MSGQPSIPLSMATSALAPALAAIVTNPADVAKTRLNMERELQPGRIGSVISCWRRIYHAEGVTGLQRGLSFVLVRESSKNAFRLGLYDPLVDVLSPPSQHQRRGGQGAGAAMSTRVLAGAISGGLSALIANPLDLLKTRLQLDPSRAAGNSASAALQQFVAAEGVAALWKRGALANVCRSTLATSLGLPANSKFKELLNARRASMPLQPAVRDATAALGASLFVVVAINPIDLVRTRLFSAPTASSGAASGDASTLVRYDGVRDALIRVARAEGVGAYWKGTTASFLRVGPHQVLTFTILGVLQRMAMGSEGRGR